MEILDSRSGHINCALQGHTNTVSAKHLNASDKNLHGHTTEQGFLLTSCQIKARCDDGSPVTSNCAMEPRSVLLMRESSAVATISTELTAAG